jgi:hypothetical protein
MRACSNGSGDIESAELSVPLLGCLNLRGSCALCEPRIENCESSRICDMSSAEALALDCCFLRVCGLIAGDCRTARAGVLAETAGFLLDFLAFAIEAAFEVAGKSIFESIGDVVAAVSELGALVYVGL